MAWWCFGGCGEGTRGIKPPFPCQSDLMAEGGGMGKEETWGCRPAPGGKDAVENGPGVPLL